jgi:hypothetical protein
LYFRPVNDAISQSKTHLLPLFQAKHPQKMMTFPGAQPGMRTLFFNGYKVMH